MYANVEPFSTKYKPIARLIRPANMPIKISGLINVLLLAPIAFIAISSESADSLLKAISVARSPAIGIVI